MAATTIITTATTIIWTFSVICVSFDSVAFKHSHEQYGLSMRKCFHIGRSMSNDDEVPFYRAKHGNWWKPPICKLCEHHINKQILIAYTKSLRLIRIMIAFDPNNRAFFSMFACPLSFHSFSLLLFSSFPSLPPLFRQNPIETRITTGIPQFYFIFSAQTKNSRKWLKPRLRTLSKIPAKVESITARQTLDEWTR